MGLSLSLLRQMGEIEKSQDLSHYDQNADLEARVESRSPHEGSQGRRQVLYCTKLIGGLSYMRACNIRHTVMTRIKVKMCPRTQGQMLTKNQNERGQAHPQELVSVVRWDQGNCCRMTSTILICRPTPPISSGHLRWAGELRH